MGKNQAHLAFITYGVSLWLQAIWWSLYWVAIVYAKGVRVTKNQTCYGLGWIEKTKNPPMIRLLHFSLQSIPWEG